MKKKVKKKPSPRVAPPEGGKWVKVPSKPDKPSDDHVWNGCRWVQV